jgi:hypothetical protein
MTIDITASAKAYYASIFSGIILPGKLRGTGLQDLGPPGHESGSCGRFFTIES